MVDPHLLGKPQGSQEWQLPEENKVSSAQAHKHSLMEQIGLGPTEKYPEYRQAGMGVNGNIRGTDCWGLIGVCQCKLPSPHEAEVDKAGCSP